MTMGTKTKRGANATIVFLYLMILLLPFLFSIQNDWLVFLEQPLFLFLPSLLTAFLFGLFHFNLEQFFYTTVMGLVLTAVVLITNSLYAGIFLHILYNFTVSLPDILYIESGSALDSFMGYVYNTDTWLPALLSTAVILTILLHLHKKENGVRLNLIK